MDCDLYQQMPFRRAAGEGFRPGGLALTDELAAACGLKPGDRVLDLACGAGATASHLAGAYGAAVTGLDSSPEFLAEARRRDPDLDWVLGTAATLPFEANTFDVVFTECFLSTFADPVPVLREVRRVLRGGGRLAVTDMYLRGPAAAGAGGRGPAVGAQPGSGEPAAAEPGGAPAASAQPGAGLPASTCLTGARDKDAMLAAYETAGFRVALWEDRSDTLNVLMASLIMEYGSAAAFWEAAAGGDAGAAVRGRALAASRPGYYLLVAEPVEAASA